MSNEKLYEAYEKLKQSKELLSTEVVEEDDKAESDNHLSIKMAEIIAALMDDDTIDPMVMSFIKNPPPEGLTVLVTGGRAYPHIKHVYEALDAIASESGIKKVIQGGHHSGADSYARLWVLEKYKGGNPIHCVTVPAQWNIHGKAAGPIRNQQMVDMEPDLVLAFEGGAGTKDCVKRAKKAGIPVYTVQHD